MFDLLLALLFARALVVAGWRRFPAGLVGGGAGVLLWLGLVAAGWYGGEAGALGMAGVWMMLLFGPSAVPGPAAGVPLSAVLAAHPAAAKLLVGAAFAAPFALAWRRAQRWSPLSDEASAQKRLGLVFLLPALLLVLQALCAGIAELAVADRM